jgi:hypothetical protein
MVPNSKTSFTRLFRAFPQAYPKRECKLMRTTDLACIVAVWADPSFVPTILSVRLSFLLLNANDIGNNDSSFTYVNTTDPDLMDALFDRFSRVYHTLREDFRDSLSMISPKTYSVTSPTASILLLTPSRRPKLSRRTRGWTLNTIVTIQRSCQCRSASKRPLNVHQWPEHCNFIGLHVRVGLWIHCWRKKTEFGAVPAGAFGKEGWSEQITLPPSICAVVREPPWEGRVQAVDV